MKCGALVEGCISLVEDQKKNNDWVLIVHALKLFERCIAMCDSFSWVGRCNIIIDICFPPVMQQTLDIWLSIYIHWLRMLKSVFAQLTNIVLFQCNVIGYEYSGYGQSTGRPTEKNTFADIR